MRKSLKQTLAQSQSLWRSQHSSLHKKYRSTAASIILKPSEDNSFGPFARETESIVSSSAKVSMAGNSNKRYTRMPIPSHLTVKKLNLPHQLNATCNPARVLSAKSSPVLQMKVHEKTKNKSSSITRQTSKHSLNDANKTVKSKIDNSMPLSLKAKTRAHHASKESVTNLKQRIPSVSINQRSIKPQFNSKTRKTSHGSLSKPKDTLSKPQYHSRKNTQVNSNLMASTFKPISKKSTSFSQVSL